MPTTKLSKEDIIETHLRIKRKIFYTPVLTSSTINSILGCRLYFKCENFQKVGAFKFRGATNALLCLTRDVFSKGAATHSSGNHAAAVALAAKTHGVPSFVVMPKNAPVIKRNAVTGYGANITFCEPNLQSREETLAKIVEETGANFIHPYDNDNVIAGAATCAKEMFEELDNLDYLIAPVGGGGLLSGSGLSAKYFSPKTRVIGAEPKGADDAFRSIRDKKIHPSINPQTICDGLLTQLSDRTFKIISEDVHRIITVKEETIVNAMRMIWERMKIIVEPSAAITLAVVMENPRKFSKRRVGLILSGGNVDLDNLPWL